MKTDFYKHIPKFKKQLADCYKTFQAPIQETFQKIKADYNLLDCIKLENLLQSQKNIKPLQDSTKKEIFKFFIQKQLQSFEFLKARSRVILRILKLTKVKLENYKLDWKDIWNRILIEFPQIRRKEFFQLQQFLRTLKIFFDVNNAVDVFKYFCGHYGYNKSHLFSFIFIFANITHKTEETVFAQFLEELVQCYYKSQQIQPKTLVIYFVNLLKKRKQSQIPVDKYQLLNNIILNGLITPSSTDSKNSIESQFTKQSAILIGQFIGQDNPFSEQLIKLIFQITIKFINPFDNSSRPVRFLYNLIRFIWKRKQRQTKTQEHLKKLLAKQQRIQQKKALQLASSLSKDSANQETVMEQQQADQLNLKNQQLVPQQDEQEDEVDSDDQVEKEEILDGELNQGEEENLSNDLQQKIAKCHKILKNQITESIFTITKEGIDSVFKYVYFVNSKKTVPQFVRYSFIMDPSLILKSLDLLDKASQIPYINEEGLVQNIKITVQYMFSEDLLKQSLASLPRILDRIINCTKILDVWPIYNILCSKIPLLDQKDIEKVSQEDKAYFEQKFELNFDKFYENYSDNVFRAFKRLVRESEYLDEIVRQNNSCFQEIYLNSYPFFKKRMLDQIIDEIIENKKNQFVYGFFNPAFKLHQTKQMIIQQQLDQINAKQTEENIELRNNLVMILCYNQPLQSLKKYIRQFASKSYYRILPIFCSIRTEINFTIQPMNPSLSYFQKNPKIVYTTTRTLQERQKSIQEIRLFGQQLLEELSVLVCHQKNPDPIPYDKEMSNKELSLFVSQMYSSVKRAESESKSKISLQQISNKQKITQVLNLLYSVFSCLSHKIIDYKEKDFTFQSVETTVKRVSLLKNEKFLAIFRTLIYDSSQAYLEDIKLASILSELITHELIFNYGNQSKSNKDKIRRNSVQNSYQQLPGYNNRLLVMINFRQKIKLIHNSNLMNLIKEQNKNHTYVVQSSNKGGDCDAEQKSQIQKSHQNDNNNDIQNQLKILMSAPGNQKFVGLIRVVLINSGLVGVSDYIVNLYSLAEIQSRFYWERTHQIYQNFKNYGISFSNNQAFQMVENHGKVLLLKQKKKLKQIAIKSLKNTISLIKQQGDCAVNQASQQNSIEIMEQNLRSFKDKQKLQLLWILSVNLVLASRKYTFVHNDSQTQRLQKLNSIWTFMKTLEALILSNIRIVRRLSLFVYSLCFRKAKKIVRINKTNNIPQNQTQYSNAKSISQFMQTGYLREMHMSNNDDKTLDVNKQSTKVKIKRTEFLMKLGPYQSYDVAQIDFKSQSYEMLKKIQAQSFQFLYEQDVLLTFFTNFHTDMVSTAEQLLSMHNGLQQTVQISELVIKELEQYFSFFSPRKLTFQRIQLFFGQRFFKYLIEKDSKNKFRLILNTKVKETIMTALTNLESLDNQALILIFTQDLIYSYQNAFPHLDQETKKSIQSFFEQIYLQMASKSSGQIFKKWAIIFQKVKNLKALQFLQKIMKKNIFEDKKQICRHGLMLLTINKHNKDLHENILKFLLDNKLQLENSIVNKIVNTIMTIPEKYPIQKQNAIKYKFIDFQKEVQQGSIEKYTDRTYFIKNSAFKIYLVTSLQNYIDVGQKTELADGQSLSTQKGNEFLKNAFGLILNGINCFCHCFESSQNINKIGQLLDLVIQLAQARQETQIIDYKQLEPFVKTLLAYDYDKIQNFETILSKIMKLVRVLPPKKQAQIITIMLHRPYNFTRMTEVSYENFIFELFKLEQGTTHYKQLMSGISVIFSFRILSTDRFFSKLAQGAGVENFETMDAKSLKAKLFEKKETKSKCILFLQCEQLVVLKLDKQKTEQILTDSTKDRRNIWCREMLGVRGKREYLDEEEIYYTWKQIKENSNPYHYIA